MIRTRFVITCLFLLAGVAAGAGDGSIDTRQERGRRAQPGESRPEDQGRISNIDWSEDGRYLSFTNQGKRYRFDLNRRKLEPVEDQEGGASGEAGTEGRRPERRPDRRADRQRTGEGGRDIPRPGRGRQYMTERSPDGEWYAVCKDWNVVLENDETKKSVQVTTDGHRKFRYGTANWVYGEEINVRHGMWWSPDSNKLVFYEFDERPVIDFPLATNLTGFVSDLNVEGYTKAGDPNPKVSLMIYDLESRKLTPVDTGEEDQYLYDMRWTPDGKELLYNLTDRRQKRLDVMALNPETALTRVVVTETQDTWQENSPLMRFLSDGDRFIWETEKTGFRQYELRHLDGSLICTLTRGGFPAMSILEVDEDEGWLYYTAYSDDHPLCLQLMKVRLDGTKQKRLTAQPLNHSRFDLSPDRKWFTVQQETVEIPPSTALYGTDGGLVCLLAEGPEERNELAELFTFKAADGVTDLFGVLYLPEDFDPDRKYPVILSVYGGPDSRAIRNSYQRGHPDTRRGYMVARIDNRGTSGRGKAFKGAGYGKLGDVDILDQADGIRFLVKEKPFIDGGRIGIVGGSYGGYMAAMGVLRHPDVFHAAVVKSGVTHWRHYDSIYTERYMNLPQDNPEGYEKGSCMPYIEQFKGHMLIMHGMVDDNVHPNNAWQLIDALDRAGKRYESRFFPRAGHGTGGSDTQWEFFDRHLKTPSN